MYPHRPPVVSRIEYHRKQPKVSISNPDRWTAGNLTYSNWSDSTGAQRDGPCGTWLQHIIIAENPDTALKAEVAATDATVVLTEWTPVSRLTDICEWMIDTVLKHQHPFVQGTQRTRLVSSEPSTPTTCNCSTMLRHRVSSEEKKQDDCWGGIESIIHPPSVFWNHGVSAIGDETSGESLATFLPHRRFKVAYERQNNDSADMTQSQEAMDCQLDD